MEATSEASFDILTAIRFSHFWNPACVGSFFIFSHHSYLVGMKEFLVSILMIPFSRVDLRFSGDLEMQLESQLFQ